MMTREEITLIKQSWTVFRNMDPMLVGDVFYSKLFLENPELRKMFPVQMEAQYRKLMDMLSTIVARLERPDEITSDIVALAKRHKNYGVRPEHYNLVGNALLWTLNKGLAVEWTPQVKSAWTNCLTALTTAMIRAAGYEDK